jgi:cytochrome b involved in lipid metabolism
MSNSLNLRKLPGMWLVVNNQVYDVSNFTDHPGGVEIFKSNKGKDATEDFNKAGHSDEAKKDMEKYLVGKLPDITQEELSKHTTEDDVWMAIHGRVYDVTSFSDHPGGHEILVDHSGKDSTKAFDDIDHSLTAKQDLQKYLVGNFIPGPAAEPVKAGPNYFLFSIVLAIAVVLIRYMLIS